MFWYSLFFIVAIQFGTVVDGTHVFRALYTAVSGISGFPEFVVLCYVDDELIGRYESTDQRLEPHGKWIVGAVDEDYWDRNSKILQSTQKKFKLNMRIMKDRTNQTSGIHSLQLMYVCSMNDGTSSGFFQYGYDGQDYITFDKETLTWTAGTQTAVITKNKLDSNTAENMQIKGYLEQTCIEWLQKYIKYGQTSLRRKVPPEAKMTDKTESGSTKLKCRVSGFCPKDIDVYFVKDDNDKIETAISTGVLPNSDGTYYTEIWIEIDPQDKYHHSCHIKHESLKSNLIVKLDSESNVALIAWIIIAAVAVILIAVIAVVIWKKKQKGNSERSSTGSDEELLKKTEKQSK